MAKNDYSNDYSNLQPNGTSEKKYSLSEIGRAHV